MVNRNVSLIFSFLAYLIIQVLFLKNLVIFGIAFCFIYVLFILLLPMEMKTIPMMLIAFVLGMGLDIFYDTLGIHTACLVFIAFIRNFWLKLLTPTGGYDENQSPSLLNMGFGWFSYYSLPLFFLHHVLFFYIENLGTGLISLVIQKTVASVVFVYVMSIIVQLMFYRRKRGL